MIENEKIKYVADSIIDVCSPSKMFLISNKISTTGELTSFKLCIIISDSVASVSEMECKLYMDVDSDIPFDLVIYKNSEWEELKDDIGSFAWKINNTGTLIYG